MNIAVIGAQGKFGSKLIERISSIKPTHVSLRGTVDKGHNLELVSWADLIILSVKPNQLMDLLNEIKSDLTNKKQILTFVAGVNISEYENIVSIPITRGMSDPWWNVGGFLIPDNFNKTDIDFIFDKMINQIVILKNDKDIQEFTFLISYLFVVILARKEEFISNDSSNVHISYIQTKLKIQTGDIVLPENSTIKDITTEGGVSKKILDFILRNPNSSITINEVS